MRIPSCTGEDPLAGKGQSFSCRGLSAKRLLITLQMCLLLCICGCAFSASVKVVYIDKTNNVHIVGTDNKDAQATSTGNILDVKKSTDGVTVAWRVADDADPAGSSADLADRGSHQLMIYRDGKVRSIECAPFIRDFWFWRRGTHIGIDCGGLHFAAREILYDTATLKQVDSVDEATVPVKERPDWSDSSPDFSGD
jgi:hypothetical protein